MMVLLLVMLISNLLVYFCRAQLLEKQMRIVNNLNISNALVEGHIFALTFKTSPQQQHLTAEREKSFTV